jgi:hypothetical protein
MKSFLAMLTTTMILGAGGSPPAQACNTASQIQLYPLGVSGDALVALLLAKYYGGAERQTLEVTAELVRITAKGKPKVIAKLGHHKITRRSLARTLRPVLRRALKNAKRLRGFKRLRMTHWTTCEHRKKCSTAQVTIATITTTTTTTATTATATTTTTTTTKKLGAQIGKKQKNVSWYLSSIYRKPGDYTISSVRRFAAGKTKWAIVDLRAGDARCSSIVHLPSSRRCALAKQYKDKPDGRKITLRADSSPHHHGRDIAVAIRLE